MSHLELTKTWSTCSKTRNTGRYLASNRRKVNGKSPWTFSLLLSTGHVACMRGVSTFPSGAHQRNEAHDSSAWKCFRVIMMDWADVAPTAVYSLLWKQLPGHTTGTTFTSQRHSRQKNTIFRSRNSAQGSLCCTSPITYWIVIQWKQILLDFSNVSSSTISWKDIYRRSYSSLQLHIFMKPERATPLRLSSTSKLLPPPRVHVESP